MSAAQMALALNDEAPAEPEERSWRVIPRPEPLLGPYVNRNGSFFLPVWSGALQRYVMATAPIRLYGELLRWSWHFDSKGYPCRNSQGRKYFLHRVVFGDVRAGLFVDHANKDTTDARDENLRALTPAESNVNRRRPNQGRTPSSRYRGVTLFKLRSGRTRWQAGFNFAGRFHHQKLHESEVAAAIAYNRAARRQWPTLYQRNFVPARRTTTTAWSLPTIHHNPPMRKAA